ncbi:MAG: response regulator transcription factor [Polyangiaceae bacterium]
MPIRIVIAEDFHLIRRGLRLILEAEPTFQIVGEAATGDEALATVLSTQPDVLITDVVMPGNSGIDVMVAAKQQLPELRTIILSAHDATPYVVQALRGGANGYVLKDAAPDVLVDAVHAVVEGRRFLSQPLDPVKIDEILTSGPEDPFTTLTAREREVLCLTAEGKSHQDVSRALGISSRTAETHRLNLMRKIGLSSQAEVIRYAMDRGLLR